MTCLELLRKCNKDTITHDFVPFVVKGCAALLTLVTNTNSKYRWFIPNENVNYTFKNVTNCPSSHFVDIEDNSFKPNACCGCLIPYDYINILPSKVTNYEIVKKDDENNYKKNSFRVDENVTSDLILIECDDKILPSSSHTELLNNDVVGMDNSVEHCQLKFIKTIDNGICNISCHVKKAHLILFLVIIIINNQKL